MGRGTSAARKAARAAENRAAKLAAREAEAELRVAQFTAELRPRIDGAEFSVNSFTDSELLGRVAGAWTTHPVVVAHRGMLSWGTDVLSEAGTPADHAAFLQDGVTRLLDYARTIDPDRPNWVFLGLDNLGTRDKPKRLPSADERSLRLVEAIVTGAGQLHRHGHNAMEMFSDSLISATAAFIRRHVTWNGKEQGPVFELIRAFDFHALALRAGQPPRFAIDMPVASKGHGRLSGYDAGLYALDGSITPGQQKAIGLPGLLARGKLSFKRTGTDRNYSRLECGNELLRQAFSDGVRVRRWRHMVPDEMILNPPNALARDADTTGWRRVRPVTIFSLHTEFVIDDAYARVFGILRSDDYFTPLRTADLPAEIRPAMKEVFGESIPNSMSYDDFSATLRPWLDGQIGAAEEYVNHSMAGAAVRKEMIDDNGAWDADVYPEIRLVGRHQDDLLQQILVDLELADPPPDLP